MGQASFGAVTATGVMVSPSVGGRVGLMNWFMMISTLAASQVGQVVPHIIRLRWSWRNDGHRIRCRVPRGECCSRAVRTRPLAHHCNVADVRAGLLSRGTKRLYENCPPSSDVVAQAQGA